MGKTREVLETLKLNFRMTQVPATVFDSFAPVVLIIDKFHADTSAANANPHLTPEGKQAARRQAAETAMSALDAWHTSRTTGLDADLGAQRTALLPAMERPDLRRVDFLLSHFRDRTPEEIGVFYNAASPEEKIAMEEAARTVGRIPRKLADGGLEWQPLLHPDTINDSIMARARENNPAAVTKFEEVTELRQMTVTVAGVALSEIREALSQ
jgi:hypothetical protein